MAVVLIADDEPGIRTIASRVLKLAGHEVLAAQNGVEAVALYRSTPDRIDLVVTDLIMPVMDGYEVVRLVRETAPHAKIICMSGYPREGCPDGVVLLQKPFTPSSLRRCVEQVLGKA